MIRFSRLIHLFFCRSWPPTSQRIADNDIASVAERRMLPWDRRAPALRIPDFDPESYCISTKHLFFLSELGLQLPSVGAGSLTSQRIADNCLASVAERRMLPWTAEPQLCEFRILIRNHTVFKPNTYFFCRSWGSNFPASELGTTPLLPQLYIVRLTSQINHGAFPSTPPSLPPTGPPWSPAIP